MKSQTPQTFQSSTPKSKDFGQLKDQSTNCENTDEKNIKKQFHETIEVNSNQNKDDIIEPNSIDNKNSKRVSHEMEQLMAELSYVDQSILYYQQQLGYLYKYRQSISKKIAKSDKMAKKAKHDQNEKQVPINQYTQINPQSQLNEVDYSYYLQPNNSQTPDYSHMFCSQYYQYPYYMNYPYYQYYTVQKHKSDDTQNQNFETNDEEDSLSEFYEEEEEEDKSDLFQNFPSRETDSAMANQDYSESSFYWDQYLWH